LPKWRDLLRVYRQLEARGEIRGGRFVAGFSGEQFALPEAVAKLRSTRRQDDDGALVSLSGADPLNLAGILMPGPKLPAIASNRVLFRDGIAIAFLEAGEVRFIDEVDVSVEAETRMALMGHPQPAPHLQSRAQRASREGKGKLLAPPSHQREMTRS
jgi:ATP-dependent Lhr-like helicase